MTLLVVVAVWLQLIMCDCFRSGVQGSETRFYQVSFWMLKHIESLLNHTSNLWCIIVYGEWCEEVSSQLASFLISVMYVWLSFQSNLSITLFEWDNVIERLSAFATVDDSRRLACTYWESLPDSNTWTVMFVWAHHNRSNWNELNRNVGACGHNCIVALTH